jgi:hypothetical protein
VGASSWIQNDFHLPILMETVLIYIDILNIY